MKKRKNQKKEDRKKGILAAAISNPHGFSFPLAVCLTPTPPTPPTEEDKGKRQCGRGGGEGEVSQCAYVRICKNGCIPKRKKLVKRPFFSFLPLSCLSQERRIWAEGGKKKEIKKEREEAAMRSCSLVITQTRRRRSKWSNLNPTAYPFMSNMLFPSPTHPSSVC